MLIATKNPAFIIKDYNVIGYVKLPKTYVFFNVFYPEFWLYDKPEDDDNFPLKSHLIFYDSETMTTLYLGRDTDKSLNDIQISRNIIRENYENFWDKDKPKGLIGFFKTLLGKPRSKRNANNFFVKISQEPYDMTNNNSDSLWYILAHK